LSERAPDYWPCWAVGNHDVARVVSRWAQPGVDDSRRAKLLNAFLLSLRGTVCSYQGEELGLTEVEVPRHALKDPYGVAFWPTFKGRDGCRTPMPWDDRAPQAGFTSGEPWLPLPEGHRQRAVSVQQADASSVLHAYRAMVRFRRAQPALCWGSMQLLPSAEGIVAFVRQHHGQTLLAVFNFSSCRAQFVLPPDTRVETLSVPGHELGTAGAGVVDLPPAGVFFALLRSA